jgi:succinate dehydrogenase / fumarate reductase cytochrome b subunit
MARAMWGRSEFEASLATLSSTRLWAESVLIGVPLLFHAALGVSLVARSRPDVRHYTRSGSWAYLLQRLSGVVTLGFVLVHLWQTRIRVALGQTTSADFHNQLVALLSSTGFGGVPWWAVGYLVGTGATVYHLANGLAGFAASFGLVRSDRRFKRVVVVCALVGASLFLMSSSTIVYMATGFPSFVGGQ